MRARLTALVCHQRAAALSNAAFINILFINPEAVGAGGANSQADSPGAKEGNITLLFSINFIKF